MAPRAHRRLDPRACLLAALVVAWAGVARADTPLPSRTEHALYDEAGVVRPDDAQRIEALNHELWERAQVAIVVVTVPRLEDETIEDFAVRLGQTWGIGQRGRDRGVVIALSRDDRRIFVATGYGTEGYLPDGRVGAMIDRYAIPSLRANDFSTGLWQLDAALARASADEYGVTLTGAPTETGAPTSDVPQGPIPLALMLLGVVVFVWLAIRHPRLLLFLMLTSGHGRHRGGGGFGGGGGGFGGGGGGFGGGGAGRGF